MRDLHIGDHLDVDGVDHTIVGLDGGVLVLRSAAGTEQRCSNIDLFAFHDVAFCDVPNTQDQENRPLADLTMLHEVPAAAVQQARFWQQHVVDVLDGASHREPTSAFSALQAHNGERSSLQQRLLQKVHELKAAGHPISDRQLRRMCQRYQQHGLWGLVDQRTARRYSPVGRTDPRVIALTAELMDAETTRSTGTRTRLMRRVEQRLLLEHGPEAVALIPSPATFYRLITALDTGHYTFTDATTRRSAANRPQRPFTPTTAARPGEQVQIDATVLDVMVEYTDGIHGRAEVTVAIDIATRTLCAALLAPRASKSVDAAMLLARMIVPEPMRPGWPAALRLDASTLPHRQLIDADDRLRHATARPVIVPETTVVDHGKIFLSQLFQDACAGLGVNLQPAARRTPTDKGVVERTFSSLNTLFLQYLTAYTGRSIPRRGTDPRRGSSSCTEAQLAQASREPVFLGRP